MSSFIRNDPQAVETERREEEMRVNCSKKKTVRKTRRADVTMKSVPSSRIVTGIHFLLSALVTVIDESFSFATSLAEDTIMKSEWTFSYAEVAMLSSIMSVLRVTEKRHILMQTGSGEGDPSEGSVICRSDNKGCVDSIRDAERVFTTGIVPAALVRYDCGDVR